jgi:superfamily II DNA or RNA helicase
MENAAKVIKQEEALQYYINSELSPNPHNVAFYKATGVGKSKVALECAQWYRINKSDKQVFIGCNSTVARDTTWPKEIAEWASGILFDSGVRAECYESFKNIKDQHFAVGIFDECHYLTASNSKILERNTFDSLIFLTAREPRQQIKREIINKHVGRNKFILPVDVAVDLGILNPYKIFVHTIELDDTERYIHLFASEKDKLYTEREAYLRMMLYIQNIKQKRPYMIGQAYGFIMRKMGQMKSKTLACQYMMEQFRQAGRRFIVFAAGKRQCEWLSPYHMHSDTDDTYFQALLAQQIDELVNVEQLQENVNIPNLQRSITCQMDTNPMNAIQQLGRILRQPVDQLSIANIIAFDKTYDTHWVKQALEDFRKENIRWQSLPKGLYWTSEQINLID